MVWNSNVDRQLPSQISVPHSSSDVRSVGTTVRSYRTCKRPTDHHCTVPVLILGPAFDGLRARIIACGERNNATNNSTNVSASISSSATELNYFPLSSLRRAALLFELHPHIQQPQPCLKVKMRDQNCPFVKSLTSRLPPQCGEA